MSFLQRLIALFHRRRRAKRLGVEFHRASGWKLPESAFINGNQWAIRAPDDNGTKVAFLDIFLDDCYGVERVASEAQAILDIGAHAGFFSMHARSLCPLATIHAYEPNPANQEYLSYQSQVGGFTYFPEAVGFQAGKVRVVPAEDSVQSQAVVDDGGTIPQVSLRQCIERLGGRVDLVKLDCEGAEWGIFEDCEAWQAVAYLSMEYHLINGHTVHDVKSTVERLGFQIVKQTVSAPTWGLLWARRTGVR